MDGETVEWLGLILVCIIALVSSSSEKEKLKENVKKEQEKSDLASKLRDEKDEIWQQYNYEYCRIKEIDLSRSIMSSFKIEPDNESLLSISSSAKVIFSKKAIYIIPQPIYRESINQDEYDQLTKSEVLYKAKELKLDDIVFYGIEGDLSTNAIVSGHGGDGGGSSITGALIGGAIAGDTGAIIGSRNKINPVNISTKIQTTDNRIVEVFIKEGNRESKLEFGQTEIYKQLLLLIPNKETSSYLNINTRKNENDYTQSSEDDIEARLIKLTKMKDKNLISAEEFIEKRKEILKLL